MYAVSETPICLQKTKLFKSYIDEYREKNDFN